MDKYDEIVELEIKYITEMPAGSTGILPNIIMKEPRPITKEEIEEFIEAFHKNPGMFKKDIPRWP